MFTEQDILTVICFLIIVFAVVKYLETQKMIKQLQKNDKVLHKMILSLKEIHLKQTVDVPNEIPEDTTNDTTQNQETDNATDNTTDKYLFMLFYAPWCGHSKNFLPTWKTLEEKLSGHPKVQILTIDCTTPEGDTICKKAQIPGYPTMKLRKPTGELVDYEGGRTLQDLATFLNKNVN